MLVYIILQGLVTVANGYPIIILQRFFVSHSLGFGRVIHSPPLSIIIQMGKISLVLILRL